ncbi:glycoside hydrolase family 172 protein [Lentisphaerota bacterium WC36G]|nr:DUF2961 domain-containing protein [Lentisphaerae bacterium WC36]
MNKFSKLLTVAIAVSASLPSLYANSEISLESLVKKMVDRDALTKLDSKKYLMKAATSYDRQSKVNNPADGIYKPAKGRNWSKGWFANRDFHQFIREEVNNGRKEKVLMEDFGPGAVTRIWSTAQKGGTIRVYLDGSKTPAIEMNRHELLGGSHKFAPYPFAFLASDDKTNPDWRGCNLYLPIPYQKSCKITTDGAAAYYNIWYREYEDGVKVKTFTQEQLNNNKELLKTVGNKLLNNTKEVKTATEKCSKVDNITLKPWESKTISINDADSAVKKFAIQLEAKNYQQALRSTVVTMKFDGKQTVWTPAGALFGIGYSDEKNETFYLNVNQKSHLMTSKYVMPFKKNAEITITNYGKQAVTIKKMAIVSDKYAWEKSKSMYFNATWFELRNISTKHKWDLNYVTVLGAGRYVGTAITIFNTCPLKNNQTWWGEGDEKVYVDGEMFPSIFGTGTEDYFGYAYCRPQRFWTPFISQPRGEGNKKAGYSNNNRYHFIDDIPFYESIKFDMEVWHPFDAPMNYAATTLFYARPNAKNNIEPNIAQVQNKVALNREDVLDK